VNPPAVDAGIFPRRFPRRGEVYDVDFNPARGSEQAGRRPALIVSNDIQNEHSPVVVVAAITKTVPKKPYPFIVEIPDGILPESSRALCNQLNTIDKERLLRYRGELHRETFAALDGALCVSLGIRRS